MTSFVLPHEGSGDDGRRVVAGHGRSAGRSACAAVLPDAGRSAVTCAPADLRGYGEGRDAAGPWTTAEAASDPPAPAGRPGRERFSVPGRSVGEPV